MKQYVYLLDEPIPLSFPYLKSTLILQSDLLTNEINEIAAFILYGLYQDTSMGEIKKLVNVPHETFEEIVFHLIEHQLLDENHDLTERGEMFAELGVEIETFNEQQHEAYINLYTGELELEKEEFVESLDVALKVPIKIPKAARKLFESNIDAASNTNDIINELIDDEWFNPIFDEEFNETLHLQLKIEQKEYWAKRLITSLPMEMQNKDMLELKEVEGKGEQFHLSIPLEKHTYEPKHQLVLEYASQVPLLEQLDDELLSDKGLKILKKKLQGEQKKKQMIYHYAYIEESFDEPLKSVKTHTRKVLSLPAQFDWVDTDDIRDEFFEDLGNKWSLISIQPSEDNLIISGPYNSFFFEQSDLDDVDNYDYENSCSDFEDDRSDRTVKKVINNINTSSDSKITVYNNDGTKCKMTNEEREVFEKKMQEVGKRIAGSIFGALNFNK